VLHGNIHRHLLILSIVNWAIAIMCWGVSAYLGIAVPTSIFVYAILFVIGLFAVIVAIASFVLADFGAEPEAVPAGPQAAAPASPPTTSADD
jgi:hypothetical protein